MRLDALLDLDRELFLLVNRVQGAAWDLGFGYGTWLGRWHRASCCCCGSACAAFDRRRFPKNLLLMAFAVGFAACANVGLKELGRAGAAAARPGVRRGARGPRAVRVLPGGLEVAEYPIRDPALERARAHVQADRTAPQE